MISYLDQIVSQAAARLPDNIAVIDRSDSITYKELEEKISSISSQLINKGFKRAERAAILSRNSIGSISVYFGISRAGGISVPLDYTLSSDDIISQVKDCSVSAVYAGKGLDVKSKKIMAKAKSIRFIIDDEQIGPAYGKKHPYKIRPNDVASIFYTSGTTGKPLGAMLSHRNLISNNMSIVKYMHLKPSDKICCVLPFYYIYGLSLMLSHFLAGATVILDNRFMYPNLVLDTIDRNNATGFAGVSSHYAILLYSSDIARRQLPSLKYFMQAGDMMPPALTERLVKLFPKKRLYLMYGQTEASPRLTYLNPGLVREKPGSIGKAIPGVRIKIVDDKGRECRTDEEGEIIARGDNVMLGYWKKIHETKNVLKKRWLYTGDVAYKDKDGDIFIVGRKKDFIKTGGHRVSPADIERIALGSGKIMEAAAIGIRDPLMGERIKLFVTLVPGAKITTAEVIRLCRSKLPPYKIPSEVVILSSLPKNSFGKIARQALKNH